MERDVIGSIVWYVLLLFEFQVKDVVTIRIKSVWNTIIPRKDNVWKDKKRYIQITCHKKCTKYYNKMCNNWMNKATWHLSSNTNKRIRLENT